VKIACWWMVGALLVLPACSACDDPSSGPIPGGPSAPGFIPDGVAARGGIAARSGGGSGFTGSAGMPFPGTAGVPCNSPFACGMCFECAPGCQDCGFGCNCFDGGAPVPLPWDPPFDAVGEVGYRDSTEPWCSMVQEVYSLDVWSDERGVFALVSGVGAAPVSTAHGDEDAGVPSPSEAEGPSPMNGFMDPSGFQPRTELWWNDGRSWRLSVHEPNQLGRYELSGVPGSVLMVNAEPVSDSEFGMNPGFDLCALGVVDGAGIECLDLDPVTGVYVASRQRAAGVMGTRLLLYDGERWRGDTTPVPFPVTEVWADGANVLAAGRAGIVLWRETDGWRLEDPGTLAHITSLWGTSRENIWAGTSDGHILRYDGVTWSDVGALGGVSCDYAPPIKGIWGSGDDVYLHSATQLVRVRGSEIETLANWSCSPNAAPHQLEIAGLWGTGPSEIFIAIIDNARSVNAACGGAHIVYYDGATFHRM
jgi:hypothetical protein